MNKRIRRIILIILVFVLALGSALLFKELPSDEDALPALVSDETVTVTEEEGWWVFAPAAEADTGLVFYGGARVDERAYAPLLKRIAEKGTLCLLLKAPGNFALFALGTPKDAPARFPSVSHWYIGGHSLGGTTASLYLNKIPGTYEGLVLLGAYPDRDLSATGLRLLSVYGSEDGVMNRTRYEKARAYWPADTEEYVIEGGNHASFACYGAQKGDNPAVISALEQQERAAARISAFLKNE